MKRVAVITSSDKGYRGEREDLSGPAVKEIMEVAGYEVVSVDVLPDDRGMLGSRMTEIADLGLAVRQTGHSPYGNSHGFHSGKPGDHGRGKKRKCEKG